MQLGYYPGWDSGFVKEYMNELGKDGQRKKAEAKIWIDLQTLVSSWPYPQNITIKVLKGYESLWELIREYQGIAYRIFFYVKADEIWLLHAIEKKKQKTPIADLKLAYTRLQNILSGRVKRG